MPLLKISASKATPVKVLDYITDPKKAAKISEISLDPYRDYAEQFRETAALFGKGGGYQGRKYYHAKLSPDPADRVTAEQCHSYAEELARELFPGFECVVATHTDTDVTHSHIVINAVSYEDGRKLHINNREYERMKDLADQRAEERGLTPMHWREAVREADGRRMRERRNITRTEQKQLERLGAKEFTRVNRKEHIRRAVDYAREHSGSREEFFLALEKQGVSCPRATDKTISFRYEGMTVRGEKLGRSYTAQEIWRSLERERLLMQER